MFPVFAVIIAHFARVSILAVKIFADDDLLVLGASAPEGFVRVAERVFALLHHCAVFAEQVDIVVSVEAGLAFIVPELLSGTERIERIIGVANKWSWIGAGMWMVVGVTVNIVASVHLWAFEFSELIAPSAWVLANFTIETGGVFLADYDIIGAFYGLVH